MSLYVVDCINHNGTLVVAMKHSKTNEVFYYNMMQITELLNKRVKLYGVHRKGLEIFNPYAVTLADMRIGTPVIIKHRYSTMSEQAIYLGYEYSNIDERTYFKFFNDYGSEGFVSFRSDMVTPECGFMFSTNNRDERALARLRRSKNYIRIKEKTNSVSLKLREKLHISPRVFLK